MANRPRNVPAALSILSLVGAGIVLGCGGGCSHRPPPAGLELVRSLFPSATGARSRPAGGAFGPRGRLRVVEGADGVLGYIVDLQVVSRSGPFTIRVVADRAFRVRRAEVVEYPGRRGGQVRRRSFTRQFEGKGPDEPIRVGEDIDAVTGATISSRVMADGVRRAVRQLRRIFQDGAGT